MISVNAVYYDSHSSTRRSVRVEFSDDGVVVVRGDGIESRLSFAEVRVSRRLGNTPRFLYLPDGGRCEIADNDAIDTIVSRLGGHTANRFLHILESRYSTAIAALIVAVGIVVVIIEYGIPQLSRHIAFSLPQDIETSLGREGLDVLDREFFARSNIDEAARAQIQRLFESLLQSDEGSIDVRLELRSSERLGANAFALPAGYIVITDSLVELAQSNEELMAVMAHEIGHVKNRHVLRQILQNSLAALLVAGIFGDLTSVAGLSAALPTFLVQQKYSRRFEEEADRYAVKLLHARKIPVTHLVNILKRLTAEQTGRRGGIVNYLSSHPPTDRRIKLLLDNSRRAPT